MKKLFTKLFSKKMFTKKFWLATTIIATALIITIIALCNYKRPDTYQMALDNIAEARFYLKSAAADNTIGTVHLYSGIRESDYHADGIATPTRPFTVLSVEPKDTKVIYNGCITTEIKIGDETPVTLILEKNPYGNNYAADLETAVDANTPVQITFKSGTENVGMCELNNVMPENAISWEKALAIASEAMSKHLPADTRMETTTKILCDAATINTPYWFISFITEDGNRCFVVIAPDGKIIGTSEKEN